MDARHVTRSLARTAAAVLFACMAQGALVAQRGCAAVTPTRGLVQADRATVEVDLAVGRFKSELPFDERFNLQVALPTLVPDTPRATQLSVAYGPGQRIESTDAAGNVSGRYEMVETRRDWFDLNRRVKSEAVMFAAGPLRPGTNYVFDFVLSHDSVAPRPGEPAKRDTFKVPFDRVRLAAAPHPDATHYFDLDAGVLRSKRLHYTGVVMNVHAYAVPVSPNQCPRDYRGWDRLFKRVSVLGGISVLKLRAGDDVSSFMTTGSPLVGVGIARLPGMGPLRVNGGYLFVKQKDANPLVASQHTRADPFASVTFDFALQQVLGPLAALVGLAK